MDERFCIGNTTPSEMIKKRAEFMHSTGYRRGYYHAAQQELDECVGIGYDGSWLVDVAKAAKIAWPDTPEGASVSIIRTVLEEVCHAFGNVHNTPQEIDSWRALFVGLAKEYVP